MAQAGTWLPSRGHACLHRGWVRGIEYATRIRSSSRGRPADREARLARSLVADAARGRFRGGPCVRHELRHAVQLADDAASPVQPPEIVDAIRRTSEWVRNLDLELWYRESEFDHEAADHGLAPVLAAWIGMLDCPSSD